MITESLQNIAEGFKNKFSRETVSATVGNPRNATKQMAQKKQPPVKALNIKKPKPNKVGSVDTAFYTKKPASKGSRLQTGDSLADIGAKLFSFIQTTEDERKTNYELNRNFEREHQQEDEKNHIELINTIERQKEKQKKEEAERKAKEAKAEKERKEKEKEESIKTETTKPNIESPKVTEVKPTAAKPVAETKPSPSATSAPTKPPVAGAPKTVPAPTKPPVAGAPKTVPVPSPAASSAISTASKVGVAVIAGGVTLSAAAKLSLKAEQNVNSAEDALKPNNDPKRVNKGEFLDTSIPKVGAATPDVKNSTSYGLFGINNIRKIGTDGKPISGSSTIDSFVKSNPQLNLPDPGSNVEPAATKRFNEAWWKVSKEHPQEMLESQMNFYKNKFEQPAIASLDNSGIGKNISENPGVQVYMVDRSIAYGEALLKAAIDYAKKARTPEEFIRLISEFDDSHLRVKNSQGKNIGIYGDNTTDEKYKELEKGLHNRIKKRTAAALEHVNDTGTNLNQSSVQLQDTKKQGTTGNTVFMDNTQTNIIGAGKPTVQTIKERIPDLPPAFMGN